MVLWYILHICLWLERASFFWFKLRWFRGNPWAQKVTKMWQVLAVAHTYLRFAILAVHRKSIATLSLNRHTWYIYTILDMVRFRYLQDRVCQRNRGGRHLNLCIRVCWGGMRDAHGESLWDGGGVEQSQGLCFWQRASFHRCFGTLVTRVEQGLVA